MAGKVVLMSDGMLGFLVLELMVFLLFFLLWAGIGGIYAIYHCHNNPDLSQSEKTWWLIILLLLWGPGTLAYFIRRGKRGVTRIVHVIIAYLAGQNVCIGFVLLWLAPPAFFEKPIPHLTDSEFIRSNYPLSMQADVLKVGSVLAERGKHYREASSEEQMVSWGIFFECLDLREVERVNRQTLDRCLATLTNKDFQTNPSAEDQRKMLGSSKTEISINGTYPDGGSFDFVFHVRQGQLIESIGVESDWWLKRPTQIEVFDGDQKVASGTFTTHRQNICGPTFDQECSYPDVDGSAISTLIVPMNYRPKSENLRIHISGLLSKDNMYVILRNLLINYAP